MVIPWRRWDGTGRDGMEMEMEMRLKSNKIANLLKKPVNLSSPISSQSRSKITG